MNRILLFYILISYPIYSFSAKIYATSQTNGTQGTCIGCGVANPGSATDNDTVSYSKMTTSMPSIGDYVYQNLIFSTPSGIATPVYIAIQDDGLGVLNNITLSNLEIKSFSGGIANSDLATVTGVTLSLLPGTSSKYLLTFMPCCGFDRIQIKLNTGIAGALLKLRVYYAYYVISPLPVTLLNFIAYKNGDKTNIVWSTASDYQVQDYAVERSLDGKVFVPVYNVKSLRSSNRTSYAVMDVINSEAFYRIKIIEDNGNFSYSSIVMIPGNSSKVELKIVKSDERENLRAYCSCFSNKQVKMEVFDMKGKKVFTSEYFSKEAEVNFSLSEIGSQLLIISLYADETRYTSSLVLK